jgi:hypothetical protein
MSSAAALPLHPFPRGVDLTAMSGVLRRVRRARRARKRNGA